MLNSRVLLCITKPTATEEPQGNPLWRASPSLIRGKGIGAASSSPWQTHFPRAALQTSSIPPGAAWTISGEKEQSRDWVHWAERSLRITLLKMQMSASGTSWGELMVLLPCRKVLFPGTTGSQDGRSWPNLHVTCMCTSFKLIPLAHFRPWLHGWVLFLLLWVQVFPANRVRDWLRSWMMSV